MSAWFLEHPYKEFFKKVVSKGAFSTASDILEQEEQGKP